ncbi:MAG TPA: hypothetical protein VHC22_33600 [Pirellulales bacterium]|nr:hypothetical protein [Pirellulales bacterium]
MNYGTPTFLIAVLAACASCTNSHPAPPTPIAAPAGAQAQRNDQEDPKVKEALSDTQTFLKDMLAGQYDEDPDLAALARKLDGFQSFSIESQMIDRGNPVDTVNFSGTLKGPSGEAAFTASMVKQQNGKWMVGSFDGPNRK